MEERVTRRRNTRRSAFTLVELAISLVLAGSVAASAVLLLTSTSQTYATASTAAEVDGLAGSALDDVCEILRLTSADKVNPTGVAAPLSASSLDFQRGVGVLNSAIVWGDPERIAFEYGADEPDDGVDNDGDGFVDEGLIVHRIRPGAADEQRIVLCRDVLEDLEGELPGNLADDNGNGLEDEAGLSFDFENGRLNVRITVGRFDPDGNPIVRTVEQATAFRNYGS
jgi:hypothetical protein